MHIYIYICWSLFIVRFKWFKSSCLLRFSCITLFLFNSLDFPSSFSTSSLRHHQPIGVIILTTEIPVCPAWIRRRMRNSWLVTCSQSQSWTELFGLNAAATFFTYTVRQTAPYIYLILLRNKQRLTRFCITLNKTTACFRRKWAFQTCSTTKVRILLNGNHFFYNVVSTNI